MNWKIFRVVALVGIVSAGLIALLFVEKPLGHKLVVKSYFNDGMDLRSGARVRLAGVDVGSVKSVRVRPELKSAPVEVVMVLAAPYELKIPNDSIASLATAGLLGGTYVGIDVSSAVGPPIETDGVLKSKPASELSTREVLEKVDELLKKTDCDLEKARAAARENKPPAPKKK